MFGLDLAATIGISAMALTLAVARPLGSLFHHVIMNAAERASIDDDDKDEAVTGVIVFRVCIHIGRHVDHLYAERLHAESGPDELHRAAECRVEFLDPLDRDIGHRSTSSSNSAQPLRTL